MQINIKVESVTSFLDVVFNRKPAKYVRCYRGQSNKRWLLKPSVMRSLRANAEKQIFSELMVEAPAEFSSDRLMFDKLVRAQHYGLPTRLLDVSLNPLVSLYFACNEKEHHDSDGVVHSFDFSSERVKFADSDTVSLICNLARLSDGEQQEIRDFKKGMQQSSAASRKEFRALDSMLRLTQFIRSEKSYFTDSAVPGDLFRYFFVYPNKNNRRVIAQSGAFVAAGLLEYRSPGQTNKGFTTDKIIIPAGAKPTILEQLDTLNINSRTMFPETESAAVYIKQKWELQL